ncbi:ABC transporter permease [Pseudonocardia sp. TRM90224]|uniref:ABC transporter permease n=1 Tax=Pseudonocardia sp. TRM90224 TaxID=2812678 RepID=UPI001E6004BC|nr:ABC-2 family transporter protein [Pseudonocardia sp. TRM90224]
MFRPYPQLVRAGFRRYATYRQAMLAGLFTNILFGLLRAAVLAAVLAGRGTVGGYDLATALTYVWVGQGLLVAVLIWGDQELSRRIRSGDVVIDLGRPWDLQAAMLAADLGRAGVAVLLRLLPPVAFGAIFFPFRFPEHAHTWLLFAVSLVLAVVVSFGIRFLLNLSAFWMLEARGLIAMWGIAAGVLSGLVVPIAWYPAWAQAALWWTPFPALFQSPIDVFTERGDALAVLGHQVAWLVVLCAVGRLVLARGARRLVVQGG